MKSDCAVVALLCVVLISIPLSGVCQSKPSHVVQQDGGTSEEIAKAQAELDQLVRECQEVIARLQRADNRPAVAQVTNQLGSIYSHYGRHEQAKRCFEKALSIAVQITDPGTEVHALINLGLLSTNTGKYEQADKYYKRVLDLSRRIDNPKLSAMVHHNLGLMYAQWGKPEKAAYHYEKSIALRRRMDDKKWEAITGLNLGEVYSHLGKQDKALEVFEDSQSILRELEQTREIKVVQAGALTRLAMIYTAKGQYTKALERLEKCLTLAKECNDLKAQGDAFALLAKVSYYLGRFREAARYLNEALKLKKELNDQRGVASALGSLGILYSSIGEYDQATDYFQRAFQVAKNVHDDKEESGALINLGTVYSERGQYREAVKYFEQALGICQAIQYPAGEAVVRDNLGRLFHHQGQYDKATEHYNEAFSFFKSQGRENEQALVLLRLGKIREDDGDHEAALEKYQRGLHMLEGLGVPTNWPNKLIGDLYLDKEELRKAEHYLNQAHADSSLGRLYLRKSAYDRAMVFYRKILETGEKNRNADALFTAYTGMGLAYEGMGQLKQASDYFRKATQYTEELRSSLKESERGRFLDVKIGGFSRTTPYEGLARVLMKINKPLDALKTSEFTKARMFAESMSSRAKNQSYDVPRDVVNKGAQFVEQLSALKKEIQKAYENKNKPAVEAIEPQIKEMEDRLAAHKRMLREKYPLFAATKYPEPMEFSQTAVRDDEWVLSYDVTNPGILIYLTHGKKLVKPLFKPVPRTEVDRFVRKFREALELGPDDDDQMQKLKGFDFRSGKKLSDHLLGDILTHLPEGTPLIVITDDSLGVLPFEMLVLNEGGKITKDTRIPCTSGVEYFGDRNPLSYYQSITALTLARTLKRKQHTGKKLLALVDPVCNSDDPRWKIIAPQKKGLKSVASTRFAPQTGLVFERLPLTSELSAFLKKIYQPDIEIYGGMEANKSVLIDKDLSAYRSIVFGTHGYFGKEMAGIREPVLVLTLPNQPKDRDGFLRMTEVMGLKNLNCDIVALTACRSGLGRHISGEGTMGMGRAFQFAGAKSVLMSLWGVDEHASVNLVGIFFNGLKQGKDKLEALKIARDLVRKNGYDHPYYWASFILVGEVD